MELKIYDKQGLVKMTVSPDNSSQWDHEIGVENIVTVNVTTWEFLVMEVGWYIRVEGQKFSIKSEYRPKHINNNQYKYSLKFYGREHDTQDILFCRLNQGEYDLESVFAYDGTPIDFLQKVVDNMKRNSEGVDWKVGESISDVRKTINFNGLYCWDALNEIARTFGTEWWVDGEYLNLSKCERGEPVSLGYGNGFKSGLTQNENTNAVKWFTRLIPVGSTKNIDKNKYGYSNLQLPGREKYIDINTQYGLKEYREESAFSEIYPHRVGEISSVRSEVRKNEETGDYTVYYVKDSSLPFNPDNYMIGGEVIHMTFNSGALAGKDFEVNWNNDTNEFEIINQYPDDNTQLPGGNLIPSIGNSYVLSNISMPESYNVAAETEFEQAVDAFLLEYSKDISIYSGNTDYIYIDKHNVPLMLGQRVKLLSEQYFDGGERISRISRISRKINNLSDASVDCSDAISSSWKSSIDSSLNQLQYAATHEVVQALIKVLKSGDSEKPSEYNVLSALRSLGTFLRKDRDDSTPYGLSVGKHLVVGEKLTAKRGIQSGDSFVPGILTGIGGFIDEQGNGELESLIIRRFLEVPELRYNRVEIKLGDKWNAPGAGVLERVVPDIDKNGNRLMSGTGYLKLEEGECGAIAVGDICMGIFHSFNAEENATEDSDDSRGNFQFAGFYTCYFTITEITGNDNKQFRYQMRPVSDRWKLTYHPSEAMTFVCYGSFIREERQTSVYTTRTYTRLLKDQNTWEISASNIAMQYGNMENMSIHGIDMTGYSMYLKNIYMTGTLKQVKPDGTPINVANDRGNYIPGEVYAYYDRVSYNGSLWLCVNESGTNTEPKKGDSSWLLQVESGIGISAKGLWLSEKTPYPMNSIVTFADKVWISNKETSEPPFGTYTDNERNRLTYLDGGYILVDQLIQSNDWDLLLDAPELTNGADGESLQVRYSSDKSSWHDTFVEGDVWMQQRVGDKATWSDPIRIAGEEGAAGADGIYTDYQFAVNSSLTVAPITGWQDTPPSVGTGQFLWMRMRVVDPNTSEEQPWHTARIGGEKGDNGQGFSIEGDWKTGMSIPSFGVVTMAGRSFAAKVATTNPPMWCWTDKDGNRLIFSSTEYIITGETNENEYQLWSTSGQQGEPGPQGVAGKDGTDGKTYYTWIRYADDEKGNGISNNPTGKIYIGFSYNKSTATESNDPADYKWSRIEGEKGIPGEKGKDGIQYYTWIAYSDYADGRDMYQQPKESTKFIGIAVNKVSQTESSNPSDYTWSLFRGSDGEGFTLVGNWQTGISVPKMGVVSMAGEQYASKVATNNPPLWCWTDKDGNRLIFSATEYIITGEKNTSEYEQWTIKGQDGKDGKDGKDGQQGIQGCVVRDSEWAVGVEYRNDEGIGNGYIDVALVRSESTATGWVAYRCKKTHISSSSITTTNTTYWEEFGSNVTAIFTSLIIAKNAKINFLQGNQLLIQKSNGKVTAGISGSDDGDKSRFWAGSETPDNAPFSVTEEGVATSTKFRTGRSGLRLEVENGLISVFGSIAKNIEFGVNEEGLAVMRYYDNDGTLLYDLGPSGISTVKRANDTWKLTRLTFLGETESGVFKEYWNITTNPLYTTGVDRFQFLSGYIGNAYNDLANNRKYFKTQSKTDNSGKTNIVNDGWYTLTFPADFRGDRLMWMPTTDGMQPSDMLSNNPAINTSMPVYITEFFWIQGGLITQRRKAYYNLING